MNKSKFKMGLTQWYQFLLSSIMSIIDAFISICYEQILLNNKKHVILFLKKNRAKKYNDALIVV